MDYDYAEHDVDPHLRGKGNQHLPDAASTTFEVSAIAVFYIALETLRNLLSIQRV